MFSVSQNSMNVWSDSSIYYLKLIKNIIESDQNAPKKSDKVRWDCDSVWSLLMSY